MMIIYCISLMFEANISPLQKRSMVTNKTLEPVKSHGHNIAKFHLLVNPCMITFMPMGVKKHVVTLNK